LSLKTRVAFLLCAVVAASAIAGAADSGTARVDTARYGTLSVRVRPAASSVVVDGEAWKGPDGVEPFEIQLGEGLHRVDVRRDDYVSFSTKVVVRRGDVTRVNVILRPRAARERPPFDVTAARPCAGARVTG
jgi:hypothetical protein